MTPGAACTATDNQKLTAELGGARLNRILYLENSFGIVIDELLQFIEHQQCAGPVPRRCSYYAQHIIEGLLHLMVSYLFPGRELRTELHEHFLRRVCQPWPGFEQALRKHR